MRTPPLKKLFQNLASKYSGEWLDKLPAETGKADGTIRSDTPGLIWVRLKNGKEIEVHNQLAPIKFDIPVKIGRSRTLPKIWQVIEVREVWDTPSNDGEIAYHAPQHTFPAGDTVWIDRKQMMELTVIVTDAANFIVTVSAGLPLLANGWVKIDKQTVNLSSYVPTTGAVIVCIETNESGTLFVATGPALGAPDVATPADIPVPAVGRYSLARIMLHEGMDELTDADIRAPMPIVLNPADMATAAHVHDADYVRKFTGKTTAPTVNDDIDLGYLVTDVWMDETNDRVYILRDNANGAADWIEIPDSSSIYGGDATSF